LRSETASERKLSYLRLIYLVYHSTLGLGVIKKKGEGVDLEERDSFREVALQPLLEAPEQRVAPCHTQVVSTSHGHTQVVRTSHFHAQLVSTTATHRL